ncbi:hypothetical protein EEZ25_22115 [Micromonospora aurantiaca]|uniref:hypothetical protein n=1 Tax=Micromonospora aurantiaca (nom. illeg.) TaxID=47850 RepID=UPI000F3BB6EA|nr:hypothetical protein [Micromonospora aurantiaca]RNH99683.1 hypothetical protein EEZ25_22115 [Micromonospora aurantiaca]
MSENNGTALTRHGSRVQRRTARANPPQQSTPLPQVVPQAVIRQMIVCVSDDLAATLHTGVRNLERHFGVSGSSCRRIWVTPAIRAWQRGQLIDWQKAKTGPQCCAGGPIRLLDFTGMREGAHVSAMLRHQQWNHVVAGTRPATPWTVFLQRHLSDPSDYPLDVASAEFHRQPRVHAMRLHNAAANTAGHLDTDDLEMFQAGAAAYANYRALWALCTDALLTEDGTQMTPASAYLADRITYLHQAYRHLQSLPHTQQIFAIDLQTP